MKKKRAGGPERAFVQESDRFHSRWDGVPSLALAMEMLEQQVAITPAPQRVRVVGGFTGHQFVAKRLPTIGELNAVAPDTPVFILHLCDRAQYGW